MKHNFPDQCLMLNTLLICSWFGMETGHLLLLNATQATSILGSPIHMTCGMLICSASASRSISSTMMWLMNSSGGFSDSSMEITVLACSFSRSGHSAFQWPFFPQILQNDLAIRSRRLALPLPLPRFFPKPLKDDFPPACDGQNCRDFFFSVMRCRASKYVTMACWRSGPGSFTNHIGNCQCCLHGLHLANKITINIQHLNQFHNFRYKSTNWRWPQLRFLHTMNHP